MAATMQRCIQNPVEHLQCSILDVRLGSGYASGVKINKITKGFYGSNIALAIRYLKQTGLFPLLSFG